jgi:hypothetical protein
VSCLQDLLPVRPEESVRDRPSLPSFSIYIYDLIFFA